MLGSPELAGRDPSRTGCLGDRRGVGLGGGGASPARTRLQAGIPDSREILGISSISGLRHESRAELRAHFRPLTREFVLTHNGGSFEAEQGNFRREQATTERLEQLDHFASSGHGGVAERPEGAHSKETRDRILTSSVN